ncbi:unnamed protein product [Closterium sp. NIES-65]|nr:unnamed protein product [Closterium sp. NIES-65]CAI5970971.1 unnamed protein product [Closterium sp. NIES-65]
MLSVAVSARSFSSLARPCRRAQPLTRRCSVPTALPSSTTASAPSSASASAYSASSASAAASRFAARLSSFSSAHIPSFQTPVQPSLQAEKTSSLVTVMSHQQHRRQHHSGRQGEKSGRQIHQENSQQQAESARAAAFPVSIADGRRFHNLLADYDPSQAAVAQVERRARELGVPAGGVTVTGEGGVNVTGKTGVTVTGKGRGEESRVGSSLPGVGPSLAVPSEEEFLRAGLELKDQIVQATWTNGAPARRVRDPFLYVGLLGTAWVCFRAYQATGDVSDLALAADIIRAAADMAERHRTHYTFYCGQPGILALGAVMHHHLMHHSQQQPQQPLHQHQQQQHEELESNPYLRSFLSLLTSSLPSLSLLPSSPTDTAPATIPHELLYGRAGMLWAFLFLRRNLPVDMRRNLLPLSLARPIAAAIVEAGLSLASTYAHDGSPLPPLMYEWYGTRYLGAAHGVAGIVHVLLLLRREELEEEAELEEVGKERGATAGVREAAVLGGSARERGDWTLEEAAEAAAAALEYLVATRLPSGNYAASDEESRAAAAAVRNTLKRESSAAAAAARGIAGGGGSTGEGEVRGVQEADRLVHWCHGTPGVAPTLAHAAMVGPLAHASEVIRPRSVGTQSVLLAMNRSIPELILSSALNALSSLHQLFPSKPQLLQAAIEAGEVVWHRGLLRRVGLCHGISGNAYTFLALHRATTAGSATVPAPGLGSAAAEGAGASMAATSASPGAQTAGDNDTSALMTRHLHRARAFAGFLHANWRQLAEAGTLHCGDHPFSLMEGLGGPACLFLDMSRPNEARFPGYEL